MTELLTSAQMRAIEAAAIASGDVTGLELMERAGAGVVAAVLEEWPELAEGVHRAVVLCGPGGNGGDGFVVARLLKGRGWELEVFLYGDPERMPPDARVNYERWVGMGEVSALIHSQQFDARFGEPSTLFIDALFGTGLVRPLKSEAIDALRRAAGILGTRRVVAIDVISGICADSGRFLGDAPEYTTVEGHLGADLTVAFQLPRPGHYLAQSPFLSEKLVCADLGIGKWIEKTFHLAGTQLMWLCTARVQGDKDMITKPSWEHHHKFSHGHALILSGGVGRGGAARLAARGALRIGAGLVTVGCPRAALIENAARLDAVMLRAVKDAAALAGVLEDRRITALCLGPGLGVDARATGLVAAALGVSPAGPPSPTLPHEGGGRRPSPDDGTDDGPVQPAPPLPLVGRGRAWGDRAKDAVLRQLVLDADALTILSQEPALFAALHEDCILTPHAGEFARLFPDIAAKLAEPATRGPAYSKVDATREAATRAGCVVLFKGPDTVIADPSGRCSINSAHYDRAAPWLATAGSGDVLAGFITGLLARGFAPMQAAETAAWLHVECARSFGPGLIAEDLPEELPKVFRALSMQ